MKVKVSLTYTVNAVIEADSMEQAEDFIHDCTPSDIVHDANIFRKGKLVHEEYNSEILRCEAVDEPAAIDIRENRPIPKHW
jgi:hypothetical protein